ncbi:hypothetical protein G6F47_008006 [Rhizopus delemar]|uniref:YncI copper-binding domain-containing protein n=1 Tax=Rhizopus delemar (strain RA 99-880 / ATCC MYA-4621 / FGSC 9543 / NRRL 43880) TaxID=246409 RepID=I1CTP0_RHIO9|nr:hypothetical protein RO3G_16531 [Rhizopus delemar RA 99-880]KAG1523421.1 hypothetical protein G6F52_005042 [Rhizopus delemar]KAG1596660.1 hypothetical protein G6F47_008006 [Rhizopus delemar]|eukprot:EIE91820.1 hypothetical protein RO3G_16531 [Rhizopus delemar RA 99-880]
MKSSSCKLIASFLVLVSQLADAHVSLSPKFAEPGQNLSTAFYVPHGCNGSATIALTATVPESITAISPQAVTNWTISTNYKDSTNSSISNFTWSGGYLKPTDALSFPVILSVPNVNLSNKQNETVYFPVIQVCELGSTNWTAIPDSSANSESIAHPAPALVIVSNATQAAASSTNIGHSSGNSSNTAHSGDAHSSDASIALLDLVPAMTAFGVLALVI